MTGLPPLARRALAEAVGTGLLVMVVVGSGGHLWLAEVVASAGLVLLVFYPRRARPAAEADAAVPRRADLPPAYPDLEAGPDGGPRPGLPVPTAQGRPW